MRPCKLCLIRVRSLKNVGKAVQTDPTLFALRFSDHGFQTKFDRFQTLRKYSGPNNTRTQQHATGCANGRNM